MRNKREKEKAGFTLIELLIVIAIITLLAAMLFPVFARVREGGRRAACQSNLKQLGMAMAQYMEDNDEFYPPGIWGQGSSALSGYTVQTDPAMPGANYLVSANGAAGNADNADNGYWVTWMDILFPYVKSLALYQCPSAYTTNPASPSYGYSGVVNGRYRGYCTTDSSFVATGPVRAAEIKRSSEVVMLLDYHTVYSHYANPSDFEMWATSNPRVFSHYNGDGTQVCFADGHVKYVRRRDTKYYLNGDWCNRSWNPWLD